MRLLAKFSLIYAIVFGFGFGATAYLLYHHLQENAREQVLHDARLLMEAALAVRTYTIEQVTPALTTAAAPATGASGDSAAAALRDLCAKEGIVPRPEFHPQTIPAFAATEMFLQLRKNYPDYFYKEAALDPTNPRDRASDWEEDVIREFRNHPRLTAFDGQRDTPFGPALFFARPLRAPRACLECHSTPDRAPPEMIRRYGSANGFGWTANDVVAAQIVSVPLSLPTQMANRAFLHLLVSLAVVGVLALLALNLLLYFAVVRPVQLFALRADAISKGHLDGSELPVRGRDEIAVLAAAFNRMCRSISTAMRLLEQGGDGGQG
jgi:HAMP domain-containing protein